MGTNASLYIANMANFSDDEMFDVDTILEQRKRKGVLEYLVRWRGSGDEARNESWEPAKVIAVDCEQAVEKFLENQKTKRSRSRSGKRSRSSSRNRKATPSKTQKKSSSRSRSRGRQEKQLDKPEVEEEKNLVRSSRSKTKNSSPELNSELKPKAAVESTLGNSNNKEEVESDLKNLTPPSTMKVREQLEVQRVHNEQRPVREDDCKPRSAIWKVADYAVIVLFIISLFAAVILFLEKFMDLEDFKKQAFPNMGVLWTRLESAWQHLVDFIASVLEKISDLWLALMEQIQGGGNVKSKISEENVVTGA